jgi:nucleotide-binding universal stress UspA family protein
MKFLVNADEASVTLGLPFARAFGASVTLLEPLEEQGQGEARAKQFRQAGVETELVQRKSEWLRALRVVTRAYKYDLVIVGKMWRRGLTGFLFGTVPRPLLADIRANLLIVRRRREKIKRLLVAVGAGPTSSQVLRWSGLVTKAFDAQPTLMHVTERAPTMFTGLESVDETLTRFIRSNSAEARAFQHAAQTLRVLDIEPELKLGRGFVVDEMVTEARSGSYDLIVVGSSFVGPASTRILMQSVTTRLVQRAPCPVMVIRSRPTDEGEGEPGA